MTERTEPLGQDATRKADKETGSAKSNSRNNIAFKALDLDLVQAHYSAELQTLGEEKNSLLKALDTDRTFVLLASGAIWAWFATHALVDDLRWLYLLPLAITLLFYLKRQVIVTAIDQIGEYIQTLENFNLPMGLGWERWLDAGNRKEWFSKFEVVFWVAVLIANSAIAMLLWNLKPFVKNAIP